MAKSTIEWTDYTFNPWEGCQKVSPGCANCYAAARDAWIHRGTHWGPGSARLEHKDGYWSKPLEWQRKAAASGYCARVFCGSLCDVLEAGVHLNPLRARVFDLVPQTPNLIWLFLTKRPENWHLFPLGWQRHWPENAMFGFTAENDEWYLKRWPRWYDLYLKTVGLRSFLSLEPLLGRIDVAVELEFGGIDWVICGGESGHGARPMHPDWVSAIQFQCGEAGVPFFFKQWGEWAPQPRLSANGRLDEGCLVDARVECGYYCDVGVGHVDHGALPMYRVGKVAAGRLLEGREWSELPRHWPKNVGLPRKDARAAAVE